MQWCKQVNNRGWLCCTILFWPALKRTRKFIKEIIKLLWMIINYHLKPWMGSNKSNIYKMDRQLLNGVYRTHPPLMETIFCIGTSNLLITAVLNVNISCHLLHSGTSRTDIDPPPTRLGISPWYEVSVGGRLVNVWPSPPSVPGQLVLASLQLCWSPARTNRIQFLNGMVSWSLSCCRVVDLHRPHSPIPFSCIPAAPSG